MKKLSLILALALILAANSFAQNSLASEAREKSKGCHWVCENGEMVLYKGSKKADVNTGTIIGGSVSSTFSSDCPSMLGSDVQTLEQAKKIHDGCKSLKVKRRR
jgi:hypothetical protein